MWEAILLLFEAQIWILVFSNTRTTESGNIPYLLVELKALNVLSVTDLIRLNTTATLSGAVKQISRSILCISKPNRANSALICSTA